VATRPCKPVSRKGQSGNPRAPGPKNLPALLIEALDEPVATFIAGLRQFWEEELR
jgi:hypothetical protein